ncbi:MAG: GNAT family N-acetyltransferase [Pirellulaceae bacterium]|jgi:GNAT superfamily N-acetyltransferase|nr:GNAT family N-acetyltransferase [Pirellulaceae bacterium]
MSDAPLGRPRPLQRDDRGDDFDCGSEPLNDYLKRFAWPNQQAGAARTYVAMRGKRVAGYYTLAYASVEHQAAAPRIRRGLAQHPIPVMLLARLAVDRGEQGHGLGKGLLKDALLRTLQAAEIAGLRAVIVHAKDVAAKAFYEQFGFQSSPLDELHLMLLLKDVRSTLTL